MSNLRFKLTHKLLDVINEHDITYTKMYNETRKHGNRRLKIWDITNVTEDFLEEVRQIPGVLKVVYKESFQEDVKHSVIIKFNVALSENT